AKSGSLANISGGTLIIGDGIGGPSADVVRYFSGQIATGVVIQINASGWFDLNGISDDLGSITMNGGRIDTGAGTLTLLDTFTATSGSNSFCTLFGNLDLNGPARGFVVNKGRLSVDLYIAARVSN